MFTIKLSIQWMLARVSRCFGCRVTMLRGKIYRIFPTLLCQIFGKKARLLRFLNQIWCSIFQTDHHQLLHKFMVQIFEFRFQRFFTVKKVFFQRKIGLFALCTTRPVFGRFWIFNIHFVGINEDILNPKYKGRISFGYRDMPCWNLTFYRRLSPPDGWMKVATLCQWNLGRWKTFP